MRARAAWPGERTGTLTSFTGMVVWQWASVLLGLLLLYIVAMAFFS